MSTPVFLSRSASCLDLGSCCLSGPSASSSELGPWLSGPGTLAFKSLRLFTSKSHFTLNLPTSQNISGIPPLLCTLPRAGLALTAMGSSFCSAPPQSLFPQCNE